MIRPIRQYHDRSEKQFPLGKLTFEPATRTVTRYTPDGTVIDVQRDSLWGTPNGASFEKWLRDYSDTWSASPHHAYWDTDLVMDEGL